MTLAEVFGPNLALVAILAIGVPIWAIIDALGRPAVAFYRAGSSKTAWIMVLAVTTFLGFGLLLGAYYLIGVRGKVRRHANSL